MDFMNSDKPTAQEVEDALQAVLQSPGLRKAPKAAQLLSYLVRSRLEGRRSLPTMRDITAQLGMSGLRVQEVAAGLRHKLDNYYRKEGPTDAVRFRLSVGGKGGGYLVEFSRPEDPHLGPTRIDIRSLRLRRGLTRESLAEMAGVTPSTIRRIEAGKAARLATVAAIARALGVSSKDLLMFSPSNVMPAESEADFEVHFDAGFEPLEVKEILTALADYYRATGGAGFKIDFESQEATVREPVHA